jgi:hypothetical protein
MLSLVSRLSGVDVATIRTGVRAMDALELSEEERKTVGLRETAQGATWSNPSHVFVIEVDESVAEMLSSLIRSECDRLDDEGWSMADRHLINLSEKLASPAFLEELGTKV